MVVWRWAACWLDSEIARNITSPAVGVHVSGGNVFGGETLNEEWWLQEKERER